MAAAAARESALRTEAEARARELERFRHQVLAPQPAVADQEQQPGTQASRSRLEAVIRNLDEPAEPSQIFDAADPTHRNSSTAGLNPPREPRPEIVMASREIPDRRPELSQTVHDSPATGLPISGHQTISKRIPFPPPTPPHPNVPGASIAPSSADLPTPAEPKSRFPVPTAIAGRPDPVLEQHPRRNQPLTIPADSIAMPAPASARPPRTLNRRRFLTAAGVTGTVAIGVITRLATDDSTTPTSTPKATPSGGSPSHGATFASPIGPAPLSFPDSVYSVAFSPDGHTLASNTKSVIWLWNVTDPANPIRLGKHPIDDPALILALAFSPDGRTLAIGTLDRTVRLWNVADPANPTRIGPALTGHTQAVYSVAFSSDGRTLASGSGDNTVRLWNVADPANATRIGDQPLKGHWSLVSSLAFSPVGHTLASGGYDATVQLYDVTDPIHPKNIGPILNNHSGAINSIAFSPDGRSLASGSQDRTVRLWKVADPTQAALWNWYNPLTGHTGAVNSVAFSPDGHTLASGSVDTTIRLWNVADPAHAIVLGDPLTGHGSAVESVAFSSDRHTLASGSTDETIRLWRLAPPT